MNETIKNVNVDEKPYVFRTLSAGDVFPMATIISKIGINQFTNCFESESVISAIESLVSDDKKSDKGALIVAGSVVLEMVNVVFSNLEKCRTDIYRLLESTSNLSAKEISELSMPVFFEMVIDFIKKEEFKDFMKVVSKLLK